MFTQALASAEVLSSLVLGGVTMSAASLNLLREGRKARREGASILSIRWLIRPAIILFVSLVGATLIISYAAGALERFGLAAPRFPWGRGANTALESDSAATPRAQPRPVAATTPIKSSGQLDDWLQSEGNKLYYRFTRYLPDACPGNPIAIGNWAQGEAKPVEASCIDKDWLVLDLGPLVADGRIEPGLTYCLNFRSASGAWGLHVPENAPGLDSVAVPAVKVPLGRAIGLRYIKGLRERVTPSAESPRAAC
jgi:hypothetical protein